jgi:hypothetical protein
MRPAHTRHRLQVAAVVLVIYFNANFCDFVFDDVSAIKVFILAIFILPPKKAFYDLRLWANFHLKNTGRNLSFNYEPGP